MSNHINQIDDQTVIATQLGRSPVAGASVAYRCQTGFPVVTRNTGLTKTGNPFPTLFWLTCPKARRAVSRLEAAGVILELKKQLAENPDWLQRLSDSDAHYRSERAQALSDLSGSAASLSAVGIAGCRDIYQLKCLHAHVADWLAAGLNPIGERVLELAPLPTDCDQCHPE